MTRARTLADLGSASLATDAELASEVSTINSAIAAKPTYAFSATAPSSPSNGDLWMDTSGSSPKGKVWNGSVWKPFSGASYLTVANVTGTTGSPTTGTYTDSDGDWQYYKWTTTGASGSITFDDTGMIDVLIVGGGGGAYFYGWGNNPCCSGGMPGHVTRGTFTFSSGTYSVTVGGGSSETGGGSQFGSLTAPGGSRVVSPVSSGVNSAITGTTLNYAQRNGGPRANFGDAQDWPSGTTGSSGVVIIRVQQ